MVAFAPLAYLVAGICFIMALRGLSSPETSRQGNNFGIVGMVIAIVTTLMLPDRLGNNRVDSLRNIVRDPRAALLFLIPGVGNTLRVNGRARLMTDADLLASFAVGGKPPRSVIVLSVQAVYFQCARALVRSELCNPAKHADPKALPSAGQILAALSQDRVGGEDYDSAWPERAKQTLW